MGSATLTAAVEQECQGRSHITQQFRPSCFDVYLIAVDTGLHYDVARSVLVWTK